MNRSPARVAAVVALAFTLGGAPAAARDLAGVDVPDTATLEGTALKLNGAGLRRATMFNVKVYVGALYLTTPSTDPEAVVRADEPKSVRMHFLREVSRDKVMGAFREGFENNSGAEPALQRELEKVEKVVPTDMKPGMQLTVTYLPGLGTVVTGPEGRATIAGKPFADAMFRNWLGAKPADGDLKQAMLGR